MYIVTPSVDQRNLHDHGITISHIVVENYRDGISIGPEPSHFNTKKGNLAWNSAFINKHHVIFRFIVSKHLANNIYNVDEGVFGAIVLNNTLATKINDNQFLNIENRKSPTTRSTPYTSPMTAPTQRLETTLSIPFRAIHSKSTMRPTTTLSSKTTPLTLALPCCRNIYARPEWTQVTAPASAPLFRTWWAITKFKALTTASIQMPSILHR